MTLDAQQHADLERLLESRINELQDDVARMREEVASSTTGGGRWPEVRDSVESGDAQMMSSLDITQLKREEAGLREALAARQRMREGLYGVCEDCGEPIPFERLKVVPEARYCARDEQARENPPNASA